MFMSRVLPDQSSAPSITRLTVNHPCIVDPNIKQASSSNFKLTPPTPAPFEITPPCGAASEAEAGAAPAPAAGDDENDSTSTEVEELEDYPDQENQ